MLRKRQSRSSNIYKFTSQFDIIYINRSFRSLRLFFRGLAGHAGAGVGPASPTQEKLKWVSVRCFIVGKFAIENTQFFHLKTHKV